MQDFSSSAGYSVKSGATTPSVGAPFCVLITLCVLPSSLFYFLAPSGAVSSMAPGSIAVCLLAFGLMAIGVVRPITASRLANYVSLAAAIAGAIVVHFVGSVLAGGGSELGRTLLSLPVMMLMLAGGIALAALFRQHDASLDKALALTRWLLIGVSVLAIVGIHPWPGAWDKPVFPFSEPSHLALVLNPLMVHACVTSRGPSRALWIVGGLALAYLAESLTLAVGMIVAALLCLPMTGIVAATAVAVILLPFVDLAYFTDRLNFDPNTQNLSTLIYRQGWELVGDAMERTSGWGVGFQQLGYAPFRSASADVVYRILKNDTNTSDGGFLLAKVVSEFGVIGALAILSYLVLATRAALLARRVAQGRAPELPSQVVLAICVVCSFSVDIFVRDVGYFASSVLLFIASLYTLWEFHSMAGHALAPSHP